MSSPTAATFTIFLPHHLCPCLLCYQRRRRCETSLPGLVAALCSVAGGVRPILPISQPRHLHCLHTSCTTSALACSATSRHQETLTPHKRDLLPLCALWLAAWTPSYPPASRHLHRFTLKRDQVQTLGRIAGLLGTAATSARENTGRATAMSAEPKD
jgi:hypothetical protein